MDVDVVIVGGGPAGLSAALILGRCMRRVRLYDHLQYRNAAARRMHGYLTRDGCTPAELRHIAREEVARYPSVQVCEAEVLHAQRIAGGFEVEARDGTRTRARKLVLATGIVDRVPEVPGLAELAGLCAFHCPYCDGYELRGQKLIAIARGDRGARFALELTLWSERVVLCTHGDEPPSAAARDKLARRGIEVWEEPIERAAGDGKGARLVFRGGATLDARALFYSAGCMPRSRLAEELGARLDGSAAAVAVGRQEDSSVPGLYVVGDASRDALQAIVAAGEGSNAAIAINQALIAEDLWS